VLSIVFLKVGLVYKRTVLGSLGSGVGMPEPAHNKPLCYLFLDQKRKLKLVKRIQKQIDKFALTTDDLQIEKL